jgi:hypothetical protein
MHEAVRSFVVLNPCSVASWFDRLDYCFLLWVVCGGWLVLVHVLSLAVRSSEFNSIAVHHEPLDLLFWSCVLP